MFRLRRLVLAASVLLAALLAIFLTACSATPERPEYLLRPQFADGYAGSVIHKRILPRDELSQARRLADVRPQSGRTFYIMETPDATQEYFAKLTYLEFANEDAARSALTHIKTDSPLSRRDNAAVIAIESSNPATARRVADKLRLNVLPAGAAGADKGNAGAQFTYLQTHSRPLTEEAARHLPPARVYLIGESHGIRVNSEIREQVFKSLYHHRGVRALLMEMPYSSSVLLQKYLNTGDRSVLDEVFEHMQGTSAFTRERKQFWRNIQQWNSELEESEQIRVYGIDIEHQLVHSAAHLHRLFQQHPLSQLAADPGSTYTFPHLHSLAGLLQNSQDISYETVHKAEWIETVQMALQELSAHPRATAEWLGTELLGCKLVLQNILYRYECVEGGTTDKAWNRLRDERIYRNFLTLYPAIPRGLRFFGQWGLNHVFQQREFDVNWCAARLRRSPDSPVKAEICSIALIYEQANQRTKHDQVTGGFSNYLPISGAFYQAAQWDQTLFSLNKQGSPFRRQPHWMLTTPPPDTGVTTDFFQYAVYVRFSPASRGVRNQFH